MRFAALLPLALCLAPFASAQSESGDLREEIRKIVREEIRAAMRELHGAPSVQGKVMEVEGKPLASKIVEVKKGEPMQLRWSTAEPNSTGAKANIVMGKPKVMAAKVVEGKPLQIDDTAIAETVKGRLGEMQFHIVSDEAGGKPGNLFVIQPHAGGHEVKVVKGHAPKTQAPAECPAECKVECEVVCTTECKTECNDTPKAAKSECCEAVKAAAECCEAAKAVSECCEEAKAAAECCEGQKCEECVVEVKAVKAEKLEKAAKKQKKEGGKKKGKKAKSADTAETFELKIG
jgi:hypothetical protein